MAGLPVEWTDAATVQRRETLRYWTVRNKSPAYSKKVLKRIKEVLLVVRENPGAFEETEFEGLRIREAIIGSFSLFYTVRDGIIMIITFWDQRQDPDKLEQLLSE